MTVQQNIMQTHSKNKKGVMNIIKVQHSKIKIMWETLRNSQSKHIAFQPLHLCTLQAESPKNTEPFLLVVSMAMQVEIHGCQHWSWWLCSLHNYTRVRKWTYVSQCCQQNRFGMFKVTFPLVGSFKLKLQIHFLNTWSPVMVIL